jgi:hypothetical protein
MIDKSGFKLNRVISHETKHIRLMGAIQEAELRFLTREFERWNFYFIWKYGKNKGNFEYLRLSNWNYFDINDIRPNIIITIIAIHSSHTVKTGNSKKRIRNIIPSPTRDPPLACWVSTIFFHLHYVNSI